MQVLEFVFGSFWRFIGSMMLLSLTYKFIIILWYRFLRYWEIRKHGYPPAHCDADSDSKKEIE